MPKNKATNVKKAREHLAQAIKEGLPSTVIEERRSVLRAAIHNRYRQPHKGKNNRSK